MSKRFKWKNWLTFLIVGVFITLGGLCVNTVYGANAPQIAVGCGMCGGTYFTPSWITKATITSKGSMKFTCINANCRASFTNNDIGVLPAVITLNKNGGSGGDDTIWQIWDPTDGYYTRPYTNGVYVVDGLIYRSVTAPSRITSITIPTKTGHTFNGYYLNGTRIIDGTGKILAGQNYFTTNATLTASWTTNTNNIVLNANGGNTSLGSVTATYGSGNYYSIAGNLPTRTGYTFKGYYTAPTGGTQVYNANGVCVNDTGYWTGSKWTYTGTGNVTLYAQWEQNVYKVTYNGNTGITTAPEKQYTYNSVVDLSPIAEKDGYVFIGWNTDPNAKTALNQLSMPDLATSNNSDYKNDWELTLYAIYSIRVSDIGNHTYPDYSYWTEQEVYFKVWKNDNSADYRIYKLEYTFDTNIMKYEYKLNATDISDFVGSSAYSYELLVFDNAGNYNSIYVGGIDPPVPPPSRYYQTVKHYKYDVETQSWDWFDTTSELVLEGETFKPQDYILKMDGYTVSEVAPDYVVSADTTTEIRYYPNEYTVFFDADGGECSTASKKIYYNAYYKELPIPTKEGHSFVGWYQEDGTRVVSSSRYNVAGNSTLKARWMLNAYKVTYDYWTNGGSSVTESELSFNYGQSVDLSPKAQKDGYIHIGWSTNPEATEPMYSYITPACNNTLYAIYRKDITITIVERGDNGNVTREVNASIYNNETTADFDLDNGSTNGEWNLIGWTESESADASPSVSYGTTYTASESTTLYGLYICNVTISYDTDNTAIDIEPQSKEAIYNASGAHSYPTFIIEPAIEMEDNKFLYWTDETGAKYYPGDNVMFDRSVTLSAFWDAYPEIEAYNRTFTLDQAVAGAITQEELLKKVTVTDAEGATGLKVVVLNYDASVFKNVKTDQKIEITIQVTDSADNSVSKNINVFIVDTTVHLSKQIKYVRFISKEYYLDENGLVPASKGGVKDTSIWRTDEVYSRLLTDVLSKEKVNPEYKLITEFGLNQKIKVSGSGKWNDIESTWVFKQEDIDKMKSYVDEYGYGTVKKPNGFEVFFELFGKCKK